MEISAHIGQVCKSPVNLSCGKKRSSWTLSHFFRDLLVQSLRPTELTFIRLQCSIVTRVMER